MGAHIMNFMRILIYQLTNSTTNNSFDRAVYSYTKASQIQCKTNATLKKFPVFLI